MKEIAGHGEKKGQQLFLWMLLDGVGLAFIAGCTILEGFDLWKDFFGEHYDTNKASIAFWISGRSCQVIGLMLLIAHAASMMCQPEVERAGMILLTTGPLLNLCASSLFLNASGSDPYFLFNRQWATTELVELVGIVILDLSLIDFSDHLIILSAEVAGFSILACAAIIDFDYSSGARTPDIGLRIDIVHLSDCVGLGLLTVVAIAQYHIKESKHSSHAHTKVTRKIDKALQSLNRDLH